LRFGHHLFSYEPFAILAGTKDLLPGNSASYQRLLLREQIRLFTAFTARTSGYTSKDLLRANVLA